MNNKLNYFLIILSLFYACQPAAQKTAEDRKATAASNSTANGYPSFFQEILEAHGGLKNWNKLGLMQYQVTIDGKTETHLIDLKNRKSLIKGNSYTIGQDGVSVWVSPDKAAFPDKSARFYHNLYFYFYSIPFVLADPGGKYKQLNDLILQVKNYHVVEVQFGENIGDSPEDRYRLLIDPKTKQMMWLLYTVTYFGQKPGEPTFNILKYENYREQQGLLFPQQLTGYKNEKGQVGEVRYQVYFKSLELKEQQPNQRQFEKPEKSEIDSGTLIAD